MSLRWKVVRKWVIFKGNLYKEGDLMPVEFTDRDRGRNIYSRRLIQVEVPDRPSALSKQKPVNTEQQGQAKKTTPAKNNPGAKGKVKVIAVKSIKK